MTVQWDQDRHTSVATARWYHSWFMTCCKLSLNSAQAEMEVDDHFIYIYQRLWGILMLALIKLKKVCSVLDLWRTAIYDNIIWYKFAFFVYCVFGFQNSLFPILYFLCALLLISIVFFFFFSFLFFSFLRYSLSFFMQWHYIQIPWLFKNFCRDRASAILIDRFSRKNTQTMQNGASNGDVPFGGSQFFFLIQQFLPLKLSKIGGVRHFQWK